MDLKNFFNPKSIAIVGASEKNGTVGNAIAKNILNLGYGGKIYFANPKYENILGKKCYKSLDEIQEAVDLAVIIIPANFVFSEIEKNSDKIKNYVIISSGFSETGAAGEERERQILELAQKKDLHILGPNCLGFIVPQIKLNASFAGGMPATGGVSFISQSGALAVALMDKAKEEGIKFANVISIGNKTQISESDLFDYLLNDEKTKVIGMYLESVKNGKQFIASVRKISKIKPVVILKAGKSEKAQKAIASHTGALAGSDDIISAVFQKSGVLRADNLEEFINFLKLADNYKTAPDPQAVVITNAGGLGVLLSDAFENKNIDLANLSDGVKKQLRAGLPAEASVGNPIDILGDADEKRYAYALETISKMENAGAIICALTPQDQTPVEVIADEIIEFRKKTGKFIVAVFLGGEKIQAAVKKMEENGISNFAFPDSAVSAINSYFKWKVFAESKNKISNDLPDSGDKINQKRKEKVGKIIDSAKKQERSALFFSEASEILKLYGINCAESRLVYPESGQPAPLDLKNKSINFSFPVALKVDDDKILHKTDRKGLILNIENQHQLDQAIRGMRMNFKNSRLIVQPMASAGMEIIVGIKRDDVFGPIILYGLGGIYTQFFKLFDYLAPPLSAPEIIEAVKRGKMAFLFEETRGQKSYNISEFAQILLGVSLMSLEIPEIAGFDINPLTIYNNGGKASALDVKLLI